MNALARGLSGLAFCTFLAILGCRGPDLAAPTSASDCTLWLLAMTHGPFPEPVARAAVKDLAVGDDLMLRERRAVAVEGLPRSILVHEITGSGVKLAIVRDGSTEPEIVEVRSGDRIELTSYGSGNLLELSLDRTDFVAAEDMPFADSDGVVPDPTLWVTTLDPTGRTDFFTMMDVRELTVGDELLPEEGLFDTNLTLASVRIHEISPQGIRVAVTRVGQSQPEIVEVHNGQYVDLLPTDGGSRLRLAIH